MRWVVTVAVGLALVACSSLQPLPIRSGEACYGCRQVIGEPKLAGEMIDAGGRAFKFDSVECLARYINEHPAERLEGVFVADYTTGRLMQATDATYVKAAADPRTLRKIYVAFRSPQDAAAFAKEHDAPATADWKEVRDSLTAR